MWYCEKQMRFTQESSKPYRHWTADRFLSPERAEAVSLEIQELDVEKASCRYRTKTHWYEYNKNAFDKIQEMTPQLQSLFRDLVAPEFVEYLERITGIEGLVRNAVGLLGAGVHISCRGGFLGMHTDFNIYTDPEHGKLDRRLNLLLYMNKGWKEEWKGDLLLTDGQETKRIAPLFNRATLFATTKDSVHGHPEPLECPEHRRRESIAVYYYTRNRGGDADFEGQPPRGTAWALKDRFLENDAFRRRIRRKGWTSFL